MITKDQIQKLSKKFNIDEYSIFREYLQLTFLSYLYQHKKAQKLFFKGGTALRLIFGSPRFSEDLDFSTNLDDMEIEKVLKSVEKEINFELEGTKISPLHNGVEGIRFRITFSQKEFKYPFSIRLDFHQQKNIPGTATSILNTEFPVMVFPIVYHLTAESILSEKFTARKSRDKGRDIFDIWFLLTKGIRKESIDKEDLKAVEEFDDKSLEKDLGQFLPSRQKQIIPLLKGEILNIFTV